MPSIEATKLGVRARHLLALQAAVGDRLARPARGGAQHGVAHLGGAVAVLERGAVGGDVGVVADGGEQVVQLVDEGVLPADDVAVGPPVLPEGVVGLGDEHGAEALRGGAGAGVGVVDLQLVEARSKAIEPFEPLISHVKAFLRPVAKREASMVPTAPFSNATAASTASSTWRPGQNAVVIAATAAISPTR
jgi:hypothetical protein